MAEIARPTLDHSKFKLVPNPEAEFLRDDFGMDYKQLPAKANWGIRSCWEILKQEHNWSSRIGSLIFILMAMPIGIHKKGSNIVFVSQALGKRINSRVSFHENLHAWLDQKRPDILEQKQNALSKNKTMPVDEKAKEVEKAVSITVANEGLAVFISREADKRTQLKEKNIIYDRNQIQSDGSVNKNRAERANQRAAKSIAQLVRAVAHPTFGSFINSLRGTYNLLRSQYTAGEYFCWVLHRIRHLKKVKCLL